MGRRKKHRPFEIPETWKGFYFTTRHIMTHEAYPIILKPEDFFKRHYEMQELAELKRILNTPYQFELFERKKY